MVQFADNRYSFFVAASQNNTIRPHEIFNRGPFAQELWVRDNAEIDLLLLMLADKTAQVFASAYRNSRFRDDHLVAVDAFSYRTRCALDMAQVRRSIV